jgi:hypothetical protein
MQEAPLFSSSLKMELQRIKIVQDPQALNKCRLQKERREGNVRKLRGHEKMEGGILYMEWSCREFVVKWGPKDESRTWQGKNSRGTGVGPSGVSTYKVEHMLFAV